METENWKSYISARKDECIRQEEEGGRWWQKLAEQLHNLFSVIFLVIVCF